MPWAVAAAAVGAAGAAYSADSARSAGNQQSDAAKKGTGEMRREFDVSRTDTAPWRDSGQAALSDLDTAMGHEKTGIAQFGNDPRYKAIYDQIYNQYDAVHRAQEGNRALSDAQGIDPGNYARVIKEIEAKAVAQFSKQYPDAATTTNRSDPNFGILNRKFSVEDFQNDPVTRSSFAFGLSEGEKAVQRMFGSRGLGRSGAAVKAATRFGTDYTNTKGAESRDRYVQDQTNLYNRLAGVSGTGQVSATNNASNAMTMGANIGQMLVGEGNARGASTIAQGNAIAGGANNIGNNITSAYWLNRVFPNSNPPPTSSPAGSDLSWNQT